MSPLQISSNAVESLFSQYKRSADDKLDTTKCPISRAAQLIKQTVSAHHSGSCYRNLSLDTCENDIHLKRKQYGKNREVYSKIIQEFIICDWFWENPPLTHKNKY